MTPTWRTLALAYVSGFANEGLAAFWVHNVAAGNAAWSGLCSLLQGTAVVVGIGESVRNRWCGVAFVLGYACGASFAVFCQSYAAARLF